MTLITNLGNVTLPTSGIDCSGAYHTNTVSGSYSDYLGSFITITDANGHTSQALKLCDGTRIEVYGAIHTHPSTSIGNPFQPSPADLRWAGSHTGITNYLLGKDGLLMFDANGNTYPSSSAQDIDNCICP